MATGTNLSLQFFPANLHGEQRQAPAREYVDFERETGKVTLRALIVETLSRAPQTNQKHPEKFSKAVSVSIESLNIHIDTGFVFFKLGECFTSLNITRAAPLSPSLLFSLFLSMSFSLSPSLSYHSVQFGTNSPEVNMFISQDFCCFGNH